MAYIALNNKFTPYTFDELVKPFAMYDAAYQQERTRTDELLEKAAALEDLSPTLDKEAYDAYQEWKGQLKAASDQLATSGLDVNTRRTITNLGDTYRMDYLPMVAKLKTRGELIKGQREYLQKHPNAFFDVDYSSTPVTEVTGSSTYNTYDLDDITTKVMTDAYGKLLNGESVNLDDYMAQYGSGLTDENRIEQVRKAIGSGVSIASANKKQKDLENYLKELQVKKSYSRGSSGGGSYSGYSGTTGTIPIPLPDGSETFMTYDKKLGKYKYQDKDGKWHTSEKPTGDGAMEDLISTYYGGDAKRITIAGIPVMRVDGGAGKYQVFSPYIGQKGTWVNLPNGGDSTVREFYDSFFGGKPLELPTDEELHYKTRDFDTLNKKDKLIKTTIDASKIADLQSDDDFGEVAKKLVALKTRGLLNTQNTKIIKYTTKTKDGQEILRGYDIVPAYDVGDWDAPIESYLP